MRVDDINVAEAKRLVGKITLLQFVSEQHIHISVIPERSHDVQENAERRGARKHFRRNAVASPVDAVESHISPNDGTYFEYAQNKRRDSAF